MVNNSKLLIRGMHGVTESTSLNWLFGVSFMLLMLSSCIRLGSDSIPGFFDIDFPGPKVVSQGAGTGTSTSSFKC